MPNKTFNTRIRNKRDTAANWETVASTFQPLDGEMIIVYTADGATRFKVGRYDSVKGRLLYYNELPFTDESLVYYDGSQDLIEMLYEYGMIDPVSNSSNEVFVENSNIIYVL